MDRNSAIGLTLIAVLLLIYFNFLAPTPQPVDTTPAKVTADSTASVTAQQSKSLAPIDSVAAKAYGSLASFTAGTPQITEVENDKLKIHFSNSGFIQEVELKEFKTYTQQPLKLATSEKNSFTLKAQYEGKDIDLYRLFYQSQTSKKGDTTLITYEAQLSESSYLRHIYAIPSSGYLINYRIESKGLTFNGKNISLLWQDQLPLVEKDLQDSRNKTTINYYSVSGEFDGLSETSVEPETEVFANPMKWIAIRQKFFVSSIIAQNEFSGGEIRTTVNQSSKEVVKDASVELYIPVDQINAGKSNFSYYFGPNDYEILGTITPDFSRNLYLGWPPVIWVNKFVIIPIFDFLENYIGNYGVIIILLVLFIKLMLTPLSYKSYLGMAKMRLLKPELDAIKEKNGDNMTQAQQDQMKLYQQAGVNPFSGCIPLILQMPILFAMFYFFPVSIELRQKAFLWAEDLSTFDSVVSLPFSVPFYGDHISLFALLMTASTLVYTWQNNQISSVQGPMKSMSYIMPVVFLFVMNSFSAGLSFYYFVSNLVTFAQQAIIKRFVDEDKIMAIMEENKKKSVSGTGKKSKFMSKLEEAMKASEEARKKSAKK